MKNNLIAQSPITFPQSKPQRPRKDGRYVLPDAIEIPINDLAVYLGVEVVCGLGGFWHAGYTAVGDAAGEVRPDKPGRIFNITRPASIECKPQFTRSAAIVWAARQLKVQLRALRSLRRTSESAKFLIAASVGAISDFLEEPRCRVCGCATNDCAFCVERTGSACSWAEPDLCTACVGIEVKPEARNPKSESSSNDPGPSGGAAKKVRITAFQLDILQAIRNGAHWLDEIESALRSRGRSVVSRNDVAVAMGKLRRAGIVTTSLAGHTTEIAGHAPAEWSGTR